MNLWSYWEGPRNPFIDTCLRSIERVCGDDTEFRLLTPETLEEYIGDLLHPNYRHIDNIAMRVGAIRVAILARFGGMWWDADTIGLRDPIELVRQYENIRFDNINLSGVENTANVLYTTWDRPPLRILNGYIYMRQGCDDALEWLEQVNKRLETQRENPVVWTELGEMILTPLLVKSKTAWRVPRWKFLPVDVDSNVARFFEPVPTGEVATLAALTTAVCIGMNYSWFRTQRPADLTLPPEKWAKSPLLIHRLLTFAEDNNELEKRDDEI